MEDELLSHPIGQIQCNGSQMMQATMGKFSFTNNGKTTHSLAKSPSGTHTGNRECTGSVEIDLSEAGPEQDWIGMVRTGKKVSFTYELPTLNVEILGILTGVDGDISRENPT